MLTLLVGLGQVLAMHAQKSQQTEEFYFAAITGPDPSRTYVRVEDSGLNAYSLPLTLPLIRRLNELWARLLIHGPPLALLLT